MTTNDTKRIALVGHCGPDAFALRSAIAGFIPGATITMLNSLSEFKDRISEFDLHLVNRVLDGTFPDDSGIALIEANHTNNPPMMLISNFPEALQSAVEAGGVMGFGKRAMRSEEARAALINALAHTSNS
ncbi:MAG: hypothetical protein ACF8MF_05555 [Phycisphaerales bacterium JB052]